MQPINFNYSLATGRANNVPVFDAAGNQCDRTTCQREAAQRPLGITRTNRRISVAGYIPRYPVVQRGQSPRVKSGWQRTRASSSGIR